MHGGVGQGLAFALHLLRPLKLGPASPAGLSTVEGSAAERTAIQ